MDNLGYVNLEICCIRLGYSHLHIVIHRGVVSLSSCLFNLECGIELHIDRRISRGGFFH